MTSNDLVVLEQQLTLLQPRMSDLLSATGIKPERIVRTVMLAVEKTPKLLDCSRGSVLSSAMTFAVLGLECDGVTGQGYILPFAGKAQPVIGYKGYNTLAGRSGYIINGAVVREGDGFDFELGSAPFVRHSPVLGSKRPIIGAWACASRPGFSPIVPPPLGIDDIMAIKARAPGGSKSDSPWNDPAIGFAAMAEKSAKRRLARYMPLNLMVVAATLDEAHEERGAYTYIDPDKGVIIEPKSAEPADTTPRLDKPKFEVIDANGVAHDQGSIQQWESRIAMILQRLQSAEQAKAFKTRHDPVFGRLRTAHRENVERALKAIDDLIRQFEGGA